jgi:branched-chain amino acid transport system ATP-binding protein
VYGYFPRLRGLTKRVSGYLSGGEMQMLLVGRALVARPKLLMLDEPSVG